MLKLQKALIKKILVRKAGAFCYNSTLSRPRYLYIISLIKTRQVFVASYEYLILFIIKSCHTIKRIILFTLKFLLQVLSKEVVLI